MRSDRFRCLLLLVAAVSMAACATAPRRSPLDAAISAAIARPPFDRAIWAIRIEEEDGTPLYVRNSDTLVITASNRKLFAAATAAACLGLDGQLETEVFRDGDDLVIRGGGDPSLGSWRYERDGDFDRLGDALRARGITSVRDVVVDVSAFDRLTIPGGWKHGNLGSDYAAPVDAIAWGENEIPVNRAVEDPALHAGNILREALILRGIDVAGNVRASTEPRTWGERLITIPSPFIAQLLGTVLKNSHNLYAEMLFKASGDGRYEEAFARESDFLAREVGLPGGSFRFVDGSGLAPDDLMTSTAALAMLRWMNAPARRATWWALLARPGDEGTLRRRLAGLESRVAAKTGTINGVNALSGILSMPDGRHRYFSIVVNHHIGDGDAAVAIIDEIVQAAARD